MKQRTLKTLLTLALFGTVTTLSSACGGIAVELPAQAASPAALVTATPLPSGKLETLAQVASKAEPTVAVKVVVAEEAAAITPVEEGGEKAESQRAFHLNSDGNLQQVSDQPTLMLAKDAPIEAQPAGLGADLPAGDAPVAQAGELVVHLNSDTGAANLRSGPALTYEVVKVIQAGDDAIVVWGRTLDGWLKVTHQGDAGWLSASLVEATAALSSLPLVTPPAAPVADAPEPAPTAVAETILQPVVCYETPIRGFGKVWGEHPEVQARLNCPSQFQEQGTNAAIQGFQNGWMLWLESDTIYSADPVYVFFNDGTYQRFGDLGPADAAKVGETPEKFFEVGDKFGKVYWEGTGARVKERLGYATTAALDSPGAFQQFYNGRMFWAGAIDRIFVIYDYYEYVNDQSIHISTWESYEDTF